MISTLLTLFLVGLVTVALLGVVFAILGGIVGIAAMLLFKIAPLILIGYLVIRFFAPKKRRLSAADREWLNS